jgi:hypothetical protein
MDLNGDNANVGSYSRPYDVGITLRVTNVKLHPTAQPGAHEDHPQTKVGRYVGSEEGLLMNNA